MNKPINCCISDTSLAHDNNDYEFDCESLDDEKKNKYT